MLVSDDLLLYYQRCDRRAFLDVFGDSRQRDPLDQFLLKLRQDSRSHRREVLSQYHYQRPDWSGEDWYEGTQATLELMEQGVESIYRGVLAASWLPGVELVSKPDLFVRHPGSSRFGDWFYVPYDIRFGKRPKLDYQIVGAFHGLVSLTTARGLATYRLAGITGPQPPRGRLPETSPPDAAASLRLHCQFTSASNARIVFIPPKMQSLPLV